MMGAGVSQNQFVKGLLDAAQPVPDGLTDADGRPAGRRYAVYRNNVVVSLREALAEGFPCVAKLIGEENFANVAGLYARQAPPQSPLMMHYGIDFPDFLAGFEPLQKIGYLADVARLELALRRSYHASDASVATVDALQALDEETLMRATFDIAPAVEIVTSPWPLMSIYNFTMLPDQPKPPAIAEDVIVLRAEFDPTPHLLPQGGADFVAALQTHAPFGAALEAAGEDFDLGATLTLLFTHAGISRITTT